MSGDESFAKRLQDIELANYWNHDQKVNEEIKQPMPLEINENNDKSEPAQANNEVPAPAEIDEELLKIKTFGDWNFRFNITDGIFVFMYGVGGLFILYLLIVLPIIWCCFYRRFYWILPFLQQFYVLGTIILRAVLVVIIKDNTAFVIIECIIIGLDFLYFWFLLKYMMLLPKLDSSERAELLKYIKDSKKTKKSEEKNKV
ncbi:unnamed protein product [Blepharisma stoltei]|uniref:Uncharacterized protein n=1 Tax=Blepharisma stoltei TaxID=1481888 RepID=A0AAU9INK2_9CILI|nr:unnamed protein product [Blepharisma stoltei]